MTRAIGKRSLAQMAGVVALAWACVPSRPFRCDDAQACVKDEARGWCTDAGYCAYADAECESELRYEAHAGDGLGGRCVDEPLTVDCFEYCELGTYHCATESSFEDPETNYCVSTCEQLQAYGEGDTVECRYGWLLAIEDAAVEDACWNAALAGGEDCISADGPSCGLLCTTHETLCGVDSEFLGYPNCWDACSRLRPGEIDDDGGETIGCHLARLQDDTSTAAERCAMAAGLASSTCIDE
jgi:hypothetical protein